MGREDESDSKSNKEIAVRFYRSFTLLVFGKSKMYNWTLVKREERREV